MTERDFPPGAFRRWDQGDDTEFYVEPRLVVHIDDPAIAALGRYFATALPNNGVILDVMSSWRSHLPANFAKQRLVGLGLNQVELNENPQLDERIVHNLNAKPALPFADATFDAAIVTVSIQYLTRPVEVFREVRRCLKPGAAFHVAYSNRMFPTKAVELWKALGDRQHGTLIERYFALAGGWTIAEWLDVGPKPPGQSDPLWVVRATRAI